MTKEQAWENYTPEMCYAAELEKIAFKEIVELIKAANQILNEWEISFTISKESAHKLYAALKALEEIESNEI